MDNDAPAGNALKITGLRKSFRQGNETVEVLKGVDLTAAPGDFIAVMGASGSGKSTFLHLAAGLLTPDAGEIAIGGTVVSQMNDHDLTCFRRRRVGLVFQDFNLIPTLTVEENVALPLLLDGRPEPEAEINALLEKLGLAHRRAHTPLQLSGGERQRVAIARALVTQPDVIVADEPTGNLDSPAGHAFCDLLRQMNAEGRTIMMVSHDPVVAAAANRVHLLKDGRFVDDFPTNHDAAAVSERYLAQMR